MVNNNILDSQEHICVLPVHLQNEFNSYNTCYKAGDFIVHFAGCYRDNVDKGLGVLMDEFCPYRTKEDTRDSYISRMKKIGRME